MTEPIDLEQVEKMPLFAMSTHYLANDPVRAWTAIRVARLTITGLMREVRELREKLAITMNFIDAYNKGCEAEEQRSKDG